MNNNSSAYLAGILILLTVITVEIIEIANSLSVLAGK